MFLSVCTLYVFSCHYNDNSISGLQGSSEIHLGSHQRPAVSLCTVVLFTDHHPYLQLWSLNKNKKTAHQWCWDAVIYLLWALSEAQSDWSLYSPSRRCFSPADKYPSEKEHLCGNSLLDGSWGTPKQQLINALSSPSFSTTLAWSRSQWAVQSIIIRDNTIKLTVEAGMGWEASIIYLLSDHSSVKLLHI